MKLLNLKPRRPEVQMSPLIDVIFLLLIFYAVTTQFVSDQRLKLDLPDAKTAEEVGTGREDRPPVVKIAKDGSIWIDDIEISEEQLEDQLAELVQRRPEQTVILKGDQGADYGVVVHVLDIARAVGAKSIQMSADKPPEE
ncbi:MAG: biopolymer transporter ExbD [Thermoanaerobaculales bacterium]|nr:biopolymer transporter ExbD [Thermoanaerobaculales bacterium]